MRVSTSAPTPAESAGADSPAARKRLKYRHEHAHYAELIGVSVRTIKRWAADGKAADDLCPLDDLPELLHWWARRMRNAPPASLLTAVAKAEREAQVVNQSPSTTTTGEKGAKKAKSTAAGNAEGERENGGEENPKAPLLSAADLAGGTLEDNLCRVSAIHAGNLALLERAFLGTNEAEITGRQRNANVSGQMLAAAQRSLDEFRRERGDVVPIADVKAEGARIHSAMAQSLLGIVIDLGVPRERAVPAVDAWFRMLRESRFFADTVPVVT